MLPIHFWVTKEFRNACRATGNERTTHASRVTCGACLGEFAPVVLKIWVLSKLEKRPRTNAQLDALMPRRYSHRDLTAALRSLLDANAIAVTAGTYWLRRHGAEKKQA